MFDIALLDKFRDFDENDPLFSVSEDVKKAWFSFLYDFCPCVSYGWSTYLAHLNRDNCLPFFEFLSASDEAFTIWLLKIKFNRVKIDIQEKNNEVNKELEPTRKKRKTGAHDSRTHLDMYVDLYHHDVKPKLDNKASVEFWEQLFFSEFFKQIGDTHESTNNLQKNCPHKLDDLPFDMI
jgi:hypothetical protein